MKKLTLKQHWRISNGLMIAGVVISTIDLIMNYTEWNWGPLIAATVLVLGGYVYHLIFVKCPYCDARLPSTGKFPTQCDKCGKSLAKFDK